MFPRFEQVTANVQVSPFEYHDVPQPCDAAAESLLGNEVERMKLADPIQEWTHCRDGLGYLVSLRQATGMRGNIVNQCLRLLL